MSLTLALGLEVFVDGVAWNLYAVDFKTADGTFSAYLHAISDEHAQSILTDLKETATVRRIIGVEQG